MKYAIPFFITIFFFVSCKKEDKDQSKKIAVSIIIDITDPHQLYPDAETVIPLFQISKNENNEALFRITPLTDRELNQDVEFHLKDGLTTEKDNKEEDENYRKKLIIQFYDSIRKSIYDENSKAVNDTPLHHSECFRTILKELWKADKAKMDTTILMVYSDLFENSSIFNVYNKTKKKLLEEHKEQVVKQFEQSGLMPNSLKGTTIFFIYNPKTREDDKLYMEMVNVYKQLLEPPGATVIVQANNQNFKL